jgi:hypothetical protein
VTAPELPIRDRFARHCADFEALWRHASRHAALARDCAAMAPTFIGEPNAFDVMLQRLQSEDHQLNDGSLPRPKRSSRAGGTHWDTTRIARKFVNSINSTVLP